MDKLPITQKGLEKLQQELKHLKSVERPQVIKAIAEAREHGDLSENAEYHAAREKQSFIEGRIAELEAKIPRLDVIDVGSLSGPDVKFGAHVTLVDEDTDDTVKYQIVGEDESDISQGMISIFSPVGRALIGKSIGDSVEVASPRGTRSFEITAVHYHH